METPVSGVVETGRMVVLSPHFDDAVLSVGPLIAAARRMGREVLVITIFTGGPVGELSEAAINDRSRYNNQDPLPIRIAEDSFAAGLMDFSVVRAGFPEVIFRRRADGSERVRSLEDIFGPVQADDSLVVSDVAAAISQSFGDDELLVPAAIGTHIDHVIVRTAAESLDVALTYYADVPYVTRGQTGPPVSGEAVSWEVAEADIDLWLEGVACYESQLPILFKGDWRTQLRAYAKTASVTVGRPPQS